MEKTTFIVLNENTFGYTFDSPYKKFVRLNVMAVDSLCGGDPLLLYSQILACSDNRRVATVRDFSHYRVSVDGYLDDDQYVFVR